MPKDVLITPLSSKIEFKDNNSVIDGVIQLDASDNLSITSPGRTLVLGNTGANVFIGDGTNTTDLVFEQSGKIRALTGKTLTLGQSDSFISIDSQELIFNGSGTTDIKLRTLSDGTLSFEGAAGQLFSISDGLSGTIFSVNDISGIPSIEVLDTGNIRLAQYGGNISIGAASSIGKLGIVQSAQSSILSLTNTNSSWAGDFSVSYSPGGVENSVISLSARSGGGSWVTSSYGDMIFRTGTANSPSERMRITSAGRVQLPAGGVLESPVSTNAQTGTAYTLVLTDAGRVIEMNNAAANTLTVPTDASVNFPIGTKIDIIQTGAGATSIAPASGVTLNSDTNKRVINAQWAAVTLIKRATDTWVLIGALKA